MNKLFKKINEKNHGQKQYIILIDEIIVNYDCFDFSILQLIYSFINVLMAVNPAAFSLTKPFEITSPPGSNVLAKHLITRHRNSFQIAVLLAHINKFLKDSDFPYKCLDTANDKPLDATKLPSGPLTIWIQRSEEASDENVLQYLKDYYLQDAKSVTLVHSFHRQLSNTAKLWLDQEKWKVSGFRQMTGSETDILVAFIEDTYANMEVFSRAKKQLIVVTTLVFKMISILNT